MDSVKARPATGSEAERASSPPIPLDDAFAHCEALVRSHYENFPVGSRLLPRPLRPHVCSIYAFARTADDFADEPGPTAAERLANLDGWEECLHACLTAPDGPIFTALAETIRRHDIPVALLADLLHAFRMDVTVNRHPGFEDLLAYARYSANPVGRLMLHLFGYRGEGRLGWSDAICTALQFANFWQDIAIDHSRDRIYLPMDDMEQFGVTEQDLESGRVTDGFRALLDLEIGRTEALFREGRPLLDRVGGRLKLELRLTWLGGMEILKKIRRNDYDIFRNRPRITARDTVRLLVHALLM